MNYAQIINIVAFVLCIILYAVALFFRVKGNVVGAVSELIAMAEATGLTGPEKMALVVAQLYNRIPAAFKGVLSENRLEAIAQWTFDWMKKYANTYIEVHKDSPENPDLSEFKDLNMELAADLVTQLMQMGSVSLRSLAVRLGIEVEGLTDNEIVKAIVLTCLEKS